jgi:CheY-like chemotaxis protein
VTRFSLVKDVGMSKFKFYLAFSEKFPMEKRTRILVVDSSAVDRNTVAKALLSAGFMRVEEAGNGFEAWSKIKVAAQKNDPFEMVILDSCLVEMTGLDMIRKIVKDEHPKIQKTNLVMMAPAGDQRSAIDAVRSGAQTYLSKPFNSKILAEKIELLKKLLKERASAA